MRVVVARWLVFALVTGCEPDAASTFLAQRDRQAQCASFNKTVIDFGTAPVFRRVEASVRVLNPTLSRLPVRVGPVRSPFNAAPSGSFVLDPGGESVLLVFVPPDGRTYQEELVLSQSDPQCPDTSTFLTGAGIPSVVVPQRLDFGPIPIGAQSERTLTILNAMTTTANLQFSAPAPFFVDRSTGSIEPMGSLDVKVRITPRMPGVLAANLFVGVSGADTQFTSLEASAGVPRLELDDTPVTVPRIPLEVAAVPPLRRAIPIFNGGDGPLSIERVEITPENFTSNALELRVTVPSMPIPPGQGGEVAVALAPRGQPGPRDWSVRLITNEPASAGRVLRFSGDAEQLEPCASPVTVSATSTVFVPPYPRDVVVTLENPNANECLVDDVKLLESRWTLTPAASQLAVPARASVTRTLGVTEAGMQTLGFTTFGNVSGYTFLHFTASP